MKSNKEKVKVKKDSYILHPCHSYIQTWSELLAPLVNMIKEGCENESALLIKSQKSNLSLNYNIWKWGKISLLNKYVSQIHIVQNYWYP